MDARSELIVAFEGRAEAVSGDALVGVFGDSCPEALIAGAGGRAVEVKSAPLGDVPQIAAVGEVVEPFMDDYARCFLHRLAAGVFEGYAAILFARDDVAALAAYQYALEMRRQGMVRPGPRLILWNLLHGTHDALHRFNLAEGQRAIAELHEALGSTPNEDRMRAAFSAEGVRQSICAELEMSGATNWEKFVFRNAGRWLEPLRHAALLSDLSLPKPATATRVALVGTASDDPALHELADTIGLSLLDLTSHGALWPACHAGPSDLEGLLRAVAEAPLHIRTNPPARFGEALDGSVTGCKLIISAVDRNDDSFGWEIPRLRRRHAVPLVDLGFRPLRPCAEWLAMARHRIVAVLS